MNYFHQNVEYMSTSCSLKLGRCHLPTSYYEMHWHNGIEIVYGCNSRYTVTAGNTKYEMADGEFLRLLSIRCSGTALFLAVCRQYHMPQ